MVIVSCHTTRQSHLTERLFLEPGRITVSHFGQDGASGALVLSEQVNFTSAVEDEVELVQKAPVDRLDTSKVYAIPMVTVVSGARFAPVREGHVVLDFVVRVPQAYLSDDYQVCLTPVLFHNDSLVHLEDVVLRGKHFIEKQEQDYGRYQEYLSGIVDPAGYDTAFVDRKAVKRELTRQRKQEFDNYYKNWDKFQEYTAWCISEQEKYDRYNVRVAGELKAQLDKHDRKYRTEISRALILKQDTTQLSARFRQERRKIIGRSPARRQITLATVPAKYRDFFTGNITQESIGPLLPATEDSVRIAHAHLLHDRIVLNEMKSNKTDEVFRRIVPYPYLPDAHYSATIVSDYNFNYRYTQEYPVTRGLTNLKLILKGYIAATDRSRYNINRSDTLNFIISSMDELADGSLISNKEFIPEQRSEYTHAIQLLRNREYRRALDILNTYKDYNTALALACLGQDVRAYNLLARLEQNAHTHYLASILCARLRNEVQAVEHLKKACELDPSLTFRIEKDSEVSRLVKKYKLEI